MLRSSVIVTSLLTVLVLNPVTLQAGDWPQILGPDRNGVARGEQLSLKWGEAGPEIIWKTSVGSGVAGVAVSDQIAVFVHRIDDEEIVEARNLTDGQPKWTQKFPTNYQPRVMPEDGPLCVPTISGDYVIIFGASGDLNCLQLSTGKVLWTRQTHQDFGADEGYFGAGSAPVVFENLVLVNVGGFRQNAGVVAFDLKTGKTLWQNGAWQPSYSAPVLTSVNDQPIAIFCTRYETVGLNPKSGEVLFQTPFGMRGPTVNGAAPLVIDDHLFLTASYGIGNVWAKFDQKSIEVLRSGLEPLASQYTTPVPVNQSLIGIDGRQDGPPADLISFNPASGKENWRQSGFGYATLIRADKHLLIMKTDGELVITKADDAKYQEVKRVQLMNGTTRALPALSNGYLIIRNENELACFQLNSAESSN